MRGRAVGVLLASAGLLGVWAIALPGRPGATVFAVASNLRLTGRTTDPSGTPEVIRASGNAGKANKLIGFTTPKGPCKSTEKAERATGRGVAGPDPVRGRFTNTNEFVFRTPRPGRKTVLCAYLYGGPHDKTYARASWTWRVTG